MEAVEKRPFIRFGDEVYDTRRPEVVGRFCGWRTAGALVKFPGRSARVFHARFIVSRRRAADRRRLNPGRPSSERLKKLAETNGHLLPLAQKYGLTVEEYLDAIS